MIKRHSIILFLSLILLSLVFLTQANASCRMTGDALDTSNGVTNPVFDEGAARDACSAVPDTYLIEFFRISLCTRNPDVAGAAQPDLSSCVDILAESGATTPVNIQGTAETALPDIPEFTLPAGSYPYMVARLSAKLGIRHAFEATTAVAYGDSDGNLQGPGSYCWSVNNVLTSISNENNASTPFGTVFDAGTVGKSNMQCSNTEGDMSNAEFTYEVVNTMNDTGCSAFDASDGDRESVGTVGNGDAIGRIMQSATASATGCANADSILWTIDLTTPLAVTDTSNFVMNFRTTDALSIDFSSSASTNPKIIKLGNDPIQAYLTTN